MAYASRLTGGSAVSLKDYDPDYTGGLAKQDGERLLEPLVRRLSALQEKLYAAGSHAVLIVLQGTDTSGKDGTISHVLARVNPQGCRVTSFKAPTHEELAHDFLWRIHGAAPAKGMIGVFNRSHYEDVLIVRVHRLQPEAVWARNYAHINAFERLLADNGTIILKFFLHIDKQEQAERFKDRENEPDKRWKLQAGDYEDRERWGDFQRAYEDLLERCSTPYAPWHVVPANHKWFRNLAVAASLVDALEPYAAGWDRALLERGERNYAELRARRSGR
jgi:PPK2 family polyphosphate:nucleotide phosphotransferase